MEPTILPRVSDQKPLVTVISITYNHESYIRDCLEGFLMQKTNFPVEVIVHDDASTDHTADIIREYYEKRPDLFHAIIQSVNHRYRNSPVFAPVLAMAQGKYVALCEGDDYWTDPLKLQKQIDFLESHPDYSLCFHRIKQKTCGKIDKNTPSVRTGETLQKHIYPRWTISTCSVVIRREVANEFIKIFYSQKSFYFSDIILFLSASKIGKMWGMKDIMSVYNRHSSGATTVIYNLSIFRHLRHHRAIRKFFPELKEESYTISAYLIYNHILKKKRWKLIKLLRYYKIKYHIYAYCYFMKSIWNKVTQ